MIRRSRSAGLIVLALAGCAPAAPPPAAVVAQTAEATPLAQGDGLKTFMFGPPPRNHIAPALRCWSHCPDGAVAK